MNDRIQILLDSLAETNESRAAELAELTDEQLSETRDELRAAFAEIRDEAGDTVSAEDLEALRAIVAGVKVLEGEQSRRAEAAEAAQAEASQRADEAAALAAELSGGRSSSRSW